MNTHKRYISKKPPKPTASSPPEKKYYPLCNTK